MKYVIAGLTVGLILGCVSCADPSSVVPTGETKTIDGVCWQKWSDNQWRTDWMPPKEGVCAVG